ncbi:hypothetical protein L218DRAFT_1074809 [Marasmius fiardii PR-910]|nr:hypothetical protein L218DRAFT_1074809 [Marasmius fiardii PR-910]
MASTDRPRRSTRKATKVIEDTEPDEKPATSSNGKRKAIAVTNTNNDDGEYELSDLLEYPGSVLTTMEISNLINASTWEMLSPESRAKLARLLPSTAFKGYTPKIGLEHPACQRQSSGPSTGSGSSPSSSDHPNRDPDPDSTTVEPNFFTDLHFLAAARTFQDHIYSGWLTEEHKEKVRNWEEDVRDGKLAAPWKDEEWEKNAAEEAQEAEETAAVTPGSASKSPGKARTNVKRATQASEVKLYDLARHSVIRVGDVLSYKRHFSQLDVIVEKDVLIDSINTRQRSLDILLERGSTQHLPLNLLLSDPEHDDNSTTQVVDAPSLSKLETAILDFDGRVARDKRPNGNAWRNFTVWRWRDGAEGGFGGSEDKGGRENHGTMFYLRGCFVSDLR